MPKGIDIGGYFDKLKSGAKGGKRQSKGSAKSSSSTPSSSGSSSSTSSSPTSTTGRAPSGGLGGRLRDAAQKTRDTVERAAGRGKGHTVDRPGGDDTKIARGGAVTIEYSPKEDGDPDPGEVVWTWVPYEEDSSQGKDRPVVVIGRRGGTLVGIPLTTKADDKEVQVKVGSGDWDPQRRTSYARVWRLLEIDEQATRREGAVLDRERFDELVAVIDDYYDVRQAPDTTQSNNYDY